MINDEALSIGYRCGKQKLFNVNMTNIFSVGFKLFK